jgi:hypothetical protein
MYSSIFCYNKNLRLYKMADKQKGIYPHAEGVKPVGLPSFITTHSAKTQYTP